MIELVQSAAARGSVLGSAQLASALFGLFLYFGLSPFTKEAMANVGLAVATPALRFWAIEHAGGMFLSVILVRMGNQNAIHRGGGVQ